MRNFPAGHCAVDTAVEQNPRRASAENSAVDDIHVGECTRAITIRKRCVSIPGSCGQGGYRVRSCSGHDGVATTRLQRESDKAEMTRSGEGDERIDRTNNNLAANDGALV